MKILFISPIQAGYIYKIKDNLEQQGNHVNFVSYHSEGHLLKNIRAVFNFLRKVRCELKKDYDVVNIHYPFIAALAFLFIKIKIPIVTSLHGSDVFPNGMSWDQQITRRLLHPALNNLFKKSSLITVNTEDYSDRLLSSYRVDSAKIRICPAAGFDSEIFTPRYQAEKPPYRLVFVGRIVRNKGWATFVNVYRALREEGHDVSFKLAGMGTDEKELQQMIAEVNAQVGDQQLEYVGPLYQEELADFFRSATLTIFPTEFRESLGLVGIESLACGTPVIASDLGGVKSYLRAGDNGYLVEPGNTLLFKEKIVEYFLKSSIEKEQMRRRAADSVRHFERDYVASLMQEILSEAVQRG